MAKTQILIDATELSKQVNSYRLKGILNNKEIDLDYELVINHIDAINFTPDAALELHHQSSICVFKTGPNDSKQINTLDLRDDNFTLEIIFSFNKDSIINKPKKESEDREDYTYNNSGSSYYSWYNYWQKNKTLFVNTCGYLKIYTFSRKIYIDIMRYKSIETYELHIRNSPGKTDVLRLNQLTGIPYDGIEYKYKLILTRLANSLSVTLKEQSKLSYSSPWSSEEEIGILNIRLPNSTLEACPFIYNNKQWHTTRIGHMALNDGSSTEYFFGWLHNFNLTIEATPQIFDIPDILKMNFKIEPVEINTQCLQLQFKVKKDYELNNMLQLQFKVKKDYELNNMLQLQFKVKKEYELNNMLQLYFTVGLPETDYTKRNILQTNFKVDPIEVDIRCLQLYFIVKKDYELNNILQLNFTVNLLEIQYTKNNILQLNFITKKNYIYNNFNLTFKVKSKPEDPGNREKKFHTIRNVEKYIAPYNYRLTLKDTKRIIKDDNIETGDNKDIIFEIVDKSVFFIEINNNTANLYKKETIDSQSILIASLEKIDDEKLNFKNKWTHVAITYDIDTNNLVLYIDGKKAYTTTDIKNLNCGYIQLNTFNTKKSSTYFAGITITDNIDYTSDFPVRIGPVSIPSSLHAISIYISRIIKLVKITSIPGIIITKYRVPHIRQILFIYSDNIPIIIIERRKFFISSRFIVWGYHIQTYVNIPHLSIPWTGSKIFGPLSSNPNSINGIISIYPRYIKYPFYRTYSPIIRYAESWTLDFWYFRCSNGSVPHIDILSIKNKYQTFIFSTNYFTSIFKSRKTVHSSIPYIKNNTWMYVLLSYNVRTSILSIYIDKILIYQIYIRLSSPNEILFFVGIYLTNCNFFADIRLLNIAFDDDQDSDDIKPLNPEETVISSSLKRIVKTDPGREVVFIYEGLDKNVIDYRLPMKNIDTTLNTAIIDNNIYKFNIDYICCNPYYNRPITTIKEPYMWFNVACIGPDNSKSIGYINYKSISSRKLATYTIDFWVYKENSHNIVNTLEYPLFDLIGSGNKIKVIMENTQIKYYSYINNIWTQELLINYQINNFIKKWSHIAITFNNVSKMLSVFVDGEKYVESITFDSLSLEELNIYTNTNTIATQFITSIRISKVVIFDSDIYDLDSVSHPYNQVLSNHTLLDIKVIKVPEIIDDEIKEIIPPKFVIENFDTRVEYNITVKYEFNTVRNIDKEMEFVTENFDTRVEYNITVKYEFDTVRNIDKEMEFVTENFDTRVEYNITVKYEFDTVRNIDKEINDKLFETKLISVIDVVLTNDTLFIFIAENSITKFDTRREYNKYVEVINDTKLNYIKEDKKDEFNIIRNIEKDVTVYTDTALIPIVKYNLDDMINLKFKVLELIFEKSIYLKFTVKENYTKPKKNSRKSGDNAAAKTNVFIFE